MLGRLKADRGRCFKKESDNTSDEISAKIPENNMAAKSQCIATTHGWIIRRDGREYTDGTRSKYFNLAQWIMGWLWADRKASSLPWDIETWEMKKEGTRNSIIHD